MDNKAGIWCTVCGHEAWGEVNNLHCPICTRDKEIDRLKSELEGSKELKQDFIKYAKVGLRQDKCGWDWEWQDILLKRLLLKINGEDVPSIEMQDMPLYKELVGDKIEKLEAELEEARKVIDFYGENNNWYNHHNIAKEDAGIRESDVGASGVNALSGGKRARAFNEKYKRGE